MISELVGSLISLDRTRSLCHHADPHIGYHHDACRARPHPHRTSVSSNVQSVAAATEEITSSVNEIGRQVHESNRIASTAVLQAREDQ